MKRLLALGALLALAACATPAPATTQVSKARAPIIDSSQHLRIMPLGDSVTRGDGSTSGYGYRPTTLSYIRDVGGFSNATFVGSMTGGAGNHEGHPGWTITSLGNQISNWMQTYNPDIVLIYAGLNDAGQGADAAGLGGAGTAHQAMSPGHNRPSGGIDTKTPVDAPRSRSRTRTSSTAFRAPRPAT